MAAALPIALAVTVTELDEALEPKAWAVALPPAPPLPKEEGP